VRTRYEQPITVNGDQFFPGEGPLNVKDSGLLDRMSPLQRAKMEVTRARAVGMHLYAAPRCSLRSLSPRSPPQPSPHPQLLPMLTTAVAPPPSSAQLDDRLESKVRLPHNRPTANTLNYLREQIADKKQKEKICRQNLGRAMHTDFNLARFE
jgi:hypothetical protein